MREEKEDIQTEKKKSLWSQSCRHNNVQQSSWIHKILEEYTLVQPHLGENEDLHLC